MTRTTHDSDTDIHNISIILPAHNESTGLKRLLPELRSFYPRAEILVVDDGSTDDTASVTDQAGARRISHPQPRGNGAAIKRGARHARGDILVFMDADGQHSPDEIQRLLSGLEQGYDLMVGARDRSGQASWARWLANSVFNGLATWFVDQNIGDLTSGFRACWASKFREFLSLLPNKFSYPTTSTMAFFRAGYSVGYVPITVTQRDAGQTSHIRLIRDGIRFLLIIFRIGTLYSPLRLFLPISCFFFLVGVGYYTARCVLHGHLIFSNGTGLLFITAILIFLIGLVSEQITQLLYANSR